MARNRQTSETNRIKGILKEQKLEITNENIDRIKQSEKISTRNIEGYSDYTAFNALTGKELMSKTNIINPQKKVHGLYNG